ncbi:MAG: dihydropteroate synthase [Thermoanaerobaculales bacterium]|nr:dihydropteroate synthase [Thermoanaerobaculales bacterium]
MTPAALPTTSTVDRPTRLQALWPCRRPVVMGILNCTPDSFFEHGRFEIASEAITQGETLITGGADIVDIGGESTRPGADPVSSEVELRRIGPVLTELRRRHPHILLSVDTSKAEVAEAGLQAGADLINDVSAGDDPAMFSVVAAHGAAIVLMHRRGTPKTMQENVSYAHPVAEVHAFLLERARAAEQGGIQPEHIWLDPGIGFGKDDSANLELIRALPDLAALGYPVLVGVSMKSFIGRLTGAIPDDRLPGSLAGILPMVGLNRAVVRVHDPAATLQFLKIAEAIR